MRKLTHGFLFLIQYCFYWILYPIAKLFYGNKRVWIICERGDDARDNGYWMFRHIREQHSYVNAYFIIKKHSADYHKVKAIGKVVEYKSLKHWLLYCSAEVRMTTHLAAFAPGSFIGEFFKHHKQKGVNVFLQHGITHNDFPSNYFEFNGSDLFVCGAKPEFEHISSNCNYPKGNVIYTGFARFDGLHDFEVKKQILIMPSWRSYLFKCNEEEFCNSKYYRTWSSLLTNKEIINFCEENKIKLVFYPHYSMQQFVSLFDKFNSDVVTIADFDHFDVQSLLRDSAILITDYSSILFDFAYMKKPQILYQFDENEFYGKHYKRSYFDHKNDGFGDICKTEQEILNCLFDIRSNSFQLNDLYLNKVEQFFGFFDNNNSERIYQEIVRKFIKKKKKHKFANELNVIVTGDDYGRNFESSEGIRLAFQKNYIQRASVILNKDEKDSLDLESVDLNKINLHINLTEGYQSYGDTNFYAYSVNDKNSIAYKEFNSKKSFIKISDEGKTIIKKEVKAQVEKYKKLGFNNSFFDSHGHVHIKLPIAKCIIPILKEEGFVFCRRPTNLYNKNLFSFGYKMLVSRLYKKQFKTTDYFCSCYDFIHIKNYRKFKNKTIEIMTHPFFGKFGLVNRKDIDFQSLYNDR